MLQLKQALQVMDKFDENGRAVPFDIEFVTCNRTDKTGGEIVRLKGVILSRNANRIQRKKHRPRLQSVKKNPNEWKNGTRNLFILSSKETRKCHIRLITELNGQTVIY